MRQIFLIALALLVVGSLATAETEPSGWTQLVEGLEFGRFPTAKPGFGGDETMVVLRADPGLWSMDLICASDQGGRPSLTGQEWCERNGLAAIINAGMFHTDFLTHVGYCERPGHVNNAEANEYQSVAAFGARVDSIPSFRIFDLDEPGVTIDHIKSDYRYVTQNLRLIKRPGENRWSQQPKRWSEAALGEDGQGRILFIFCRTGYSMHDFNEILLSLPLDLVCAQHLEGGPEAQLYVNSEGFEFEIMGSYETNFFEDDSNQMVSRIPVVFGLRARSD